MQHCDQSTLKKCLRNIFVLGALLPVFLSAASVRVSWEPNAETHTAGYKIYYGTHSRNYPTSIVVGNVTQYSVNGLSEDATYYFAVTAYDQYGNESDHSAEVQFALLDQTPPTLVRAEIFESDQVRLVFSEPIEKTSAEIKTNYKINDGAIVVLGAVLQPDQTTVLVTTTEHPEGTHTITINNIRDLATIPNTIATNTKGTYTFSMTDTEGPEIVGVRIARGTENDFLNVSFNKPIAQHEAFQIGNYAIQPILLIQGVGYNSDQKSVTLTTAHHQHNQNYTLYISNIKDASGNVIAPNSSITYTYKSADVSAPVLLAARIINATRLELDFNEPLDPVSAGKLANYSFSPTVAITGASLSQNQMTVILTTTAHAETKYTIQIDDIADLASPPNICGPQSKSYTYVPPDLTPPEIEAILMIADNLLSVTFNEPVDKESAERHVNYRISSTAATVNVHMATRVDDEKTVYLTTDNHPGGNYVLTVNDVKDLAGNAILSNSQKTYSYNPPDKEKPRLMNAVVHGTDVLDLRFSKPLDRISAETVQNYSISPSVAIYEAVLLGDSLNHVYLRTAVHQTGIPYTVTVNHVKDQAIVPNTIEPNSTIGYAVIENDTEPPRLTEAVLKGERFLALTFSEALDEGEARNPANYPITASGGVSVPVTEARLDLSLKKVYLTTGAHDMGVPYTVTVFNVEDRATPPNTIGNENQAVYQLAFQDLMPPIVQNVDLFGSSLLEIVFSEPVDQATAESPGNYTLRSGTGGNAPVLHRVRMSHSPNVVRLETSPHQEGLYEVSIRNIQDLAKTPNVMPSEVTWTYRYIPPDNNPPQFIRLEILADNMLRVEFNEPLDPETAEITGNYKISGGVQVVSAHLDNSLRRVILQTSNHIPDDYEIQILGMKDQYGNAITNPVSHGYQVQINDTDPPVIADADLAESGRLVVSFNEPIDRESGETISNYGINNSIQVHNVILNSTNTQVIIETSEHAPGEYTLTVNGVRDASANQNEIKPYSQFTYFWNPLDTIPPALVAVQPFSNTNLELFFSETINAEDANKIANYEIDPPITVYRASLQSEGNSVWLLTAPHEPGLYTITVKNIRDRAFTPNRIGDQNRFQYRWTSPDTIAPKLVHAELRTPMMLELVFDEEITLRSAQNLENYTIVPDVKINGAYLLEGRKIVHLETAMHASRVSYTIEVRGIQDRAPVPNIMHSPRTMTYTWQTADTVAPFITDAKLQGSTQLELVFSEKIEKTSAETRSNYTIRTGVEVKNAILDTASMQRVFLETTMHLPGMVYEISAQNIKDQAAVPNIIGPNKWYKYQLSLTEPMADDTPPQVARIDALSQTKIDVLFTKPVDQTTAENIANYAIADSVSVLSATLDSNLVRVHLTTARHEEGKPYTIRVKNIRDRAARPNQMKAGTPVPYILSDGVSVSQLSRGDYAIRMFDSQGALYSDRNYTVSQSPEALQGAIQILTCNDDKADTSRAFFHFEILGDAQVQIAYDRRSPSLPAWMQGWRATGEQVISSNATVYNLYSKTFRNGRVTLGGNAGGLDDNMYLIFVRPMMASSSLLSNLNKAAYVATHVEVGDPFYVDRDYRVASLPDSLESLLWIKTANDDKTDRDPDFLRFTLHVKSRVHVAYDTRIPELPDWLSKWEETGEEIVDTRGTRFEVFRKDFAAGEVVLGGNAGTADDNMYLVLIRPLEKMIEQEIQNNLPGYFTLAQNYPNPFNPETTIRFRVHKPGHVTLTIYNILGQRVRVLFDRRVDAVEAGRTFLETWDGNNESGQRVASGVYIYRIQQGHYALTKRMMLIK
ncbi:MAG TPA: T9SS type A sorting domain-containing protein [bacterium]|nr:T9SS type A sorting domain-containing protein [bacterium]